MTDNAMIPQEMLKWKENSEWLGSTGTGFLKKQARPLGLEMEVMKVDDFFSPNGLMFFSLTSAFVSSSHFTFGCFEKKYSKRFYTRESTFQISYIKINKNTKFLWHYYYF